MAYKTPGVYVQEISMFPPSVAEVDTAIPAFIGYTEKAEFFGIPITEPYIINSLREYEDYFGFAPKQIANAISIELNEKKDSSGITTGFDVKAKPIAANFSKYNMYYAMQLFYANGGGNCYIVSVDKYQADKSLSKAKFLEGIEKLKRFDEPTLLVIPESVYLPDSDYKEVVSACITQSSILKDRFTIVDVKVKDRFIVPAAQAAALKVANDTAKAAKEAADAAPNDADLAHASLNATAAAKVALDAAEAAAKAGGVPAPADPADDAKNFRTLAPSDYEQLRYAAAYYPYLNTTLDINVDLDNLSITKYAVNGVDVPKPEDGGANPPPYTLVGASLSSIKSSRNDLYNILKAEITDKLKATMPPSGAMAGVYARVDSTRGVWKAPANVGLLNVMSPTVNLTNDQQDGFNVDSIAGKSIDVIRSFAGRGPIVWGGRTLDGNSNEWRFINVRRFFNMVEESVQKSTVWAVFEPNTKNTWVKVKGMIESYLLSKWIEGALAGSKPEEAFFVKVGLPETMSADDILEGKMIVKIGMAVSRPAEFIILQFTHKQQTS
jgi:phage tail sheath protein FI